MVDLYTNVTISALERLRNFDTWLLIVQQAGFAGAKQRSMERLPSWVIDWSADPGNTNDNYDERRHTSAFTCMEESSYKACKVRSENILVVRGIQFSTLRSMTDDEWKAGSDSTVASKLPSWFRFLGIEAGEGGLSNPPAWEQLWSLITNRQIQTPNKVWKPAQPADNLDKLVFESWAVME